jgi:hypothetical protein
MKVFRHRAIDGVRHDELPSFSEFLSSDGFPSWQIIMAAALNQEKQRHIAFGPPMRL